MNIKHAIAFLIPFFFVQETCLAAHQPGSSKQWPFWATHGVSFIAACALSRVAANCSTGLTKVLTHEASKGLMAVGAVGWMLYAAQFKVLDIKQEEEIDRQLHQELNDESISGENTHQDSLTNLTSTPQGQNNVLGRLKAINSPKKLEDPIFRMYKYVVSGSTVGLAAMSLGVLGYYGCSKFLPEMIKN